MNTPSTSAASMSTTIPRGPPGVVTFRYQHDMGSEMAYVPLAATHEEAQEIAARSFPLLASVDPSWLFFTIAIRYKSTGERKEIGVSPNAWYYVTSKLVPYRLIDIHVVPPSSPHSSATKSYAPLYSDSPSKQDAPPYPNSPSTKSLVPPYPDTPPPKYPGSPKKQLHPYLTPTGYGYGFGWHDQINGQDEQDYPESQVYAGPRAARGYDTSRADPHEMADRRSAGWSDSSVKVGSPGWGGMGLFSSIRERIFPITWDDPGRRRRTRRRERRTRFRLPDYEDEQDNKYENASGSGRSYVPSLI